MHLLILQDGDDALNQTKKVKAISALQFPALCQAYFRLLPTS